MRNFIPGSNFHLTAAHGMDELLILAVMFVEWWEFVQCFVINV